MIEILSDMIEGFVEAPEVEHKKGVTWTETNSEYFGERFFQKLQGSLNLFFEHPTITVTSAHDSEHTPNSMHYVGRAIDLRIKDLKTRFLHVELGSESWKDSVIFCYSRMAEFFPNYVFVVHVNSGAPHVHCQFSRQNLKDPWAGLGKHHNLFIK
jgi:hypothetical protein